MAYSICGGWRGRRRRRRRRAAEKRESGRYTHVQQEEEEEEHLFCCTPPTRRDSTRLEVPMDVTVSHRVCDSACPCVQCVVNTCGRGSAPSGANYYHDSGSVNVTTTSDLFRSSVPRHPSVETQHPLCPRSDTHSLHSLRRVFAPSVF